VEAAAGEEFDGGAGGDTVPAAASEVAEGSVEPRGAAVAEEAWTNSRDPGWMNGWG